MFGSSEAATSETLALSIAGLSTSETSTNVLAVITITPSLADHLSTSIPTLKPSRSPSAASTNASDPALVFPILNTASIPVSVSLYSITLPIGRERSCSKNSLTFFKAIELAANFVRPADVLPSSFQVTIVPDIVRESLSAAVTATGIVNFIILSPLLCVFHLLIRHLCGLVPHRLGRALVGYHARSHLAHI